MNIGNDIILFHKYVVNSRNETACENLKVNQDLGRCIHSYEIGLGSEDTASCHVNHLLTMLSMTKILSISRSIVLKSTAYYYYYYYF